MLSRIRGSQTLRLLGLAIAGTVILGFIDGSMWRNVSPNIGYRAGFFFALMLLFGWRGYVISFVIFLGVKFYRLGFHSNPYTESLYLFFYLVSYAGAFLLARQVAGKQPWLSRQRSTVAFLAGAILGPSLPALLLLGHPFLTMIGLPLQGGPATAFVNWLRETAGILAITPFLLIGLPRRLRMSFGGPAESEKWLPLAALDFVELMIELTAWAAALLTSVYFIERYQLNTSYLTFLPPLVFALRHRVPLVASALAGNALVATGLWNVLHWDHAISAGELRLLVAIYSLTILMLASVVEERRLFSERMDAQERTVARQRLESRELARANEALRQSEQIQAIELDIARRLQAVATQLVDARGIEALYDKILDNAKQILDSDFASIQIFHPEHGSHGELRLLGHRGFSADAAKRWEWVCADTRTTCGEALRTRQSVAVADVRNCDFMSGSEDLEGYLAAGIHAVQSTPLISRSSELLGMISTHWREAHEMSVSELRALDVLARLAADLIERSRSEEIVRESEERLRIAERLAQVGSWKWDIETNRATWSDQQLRIFGRPQDYKPSYDAFLQVVKPDEQERITQEVIDAIENKRGFSSELQITRPDGKQRRITFAAEVQLNEEGRPVSMFGATQDITDIRNNEARLVQSQKDLRSLTARLVRLQEAGMREVARELHDVFSQELAAMGMELSSLDKALKTDPDTAGRLTALREKIGELSVQIHSASYQLHPAILEDLGLEPALRHECDSFERNTEIRTDFRSATASAKIPAEAALCLYRVLQESLRNVYKHAKSSLVLVRLRESPSEVTLRIEDSGEGFDLDAVLREGGLGLVSMEERLRLVNGKLTIESQPGKGTTVTAFVPAGADEASGTVL
jgi:signal transduction histidine kinase